MKHDLPLARLLLHLFILLLAASPKAYSQEAEDSIINFTGAVKNEFITDKVLFFKDSTGKLTLDEVKQQQFQISKLKVLNLGVSDATYWIKINVYNNSPYTVMSLEVDNPLLTHIMLYYPQGAGSYATKEISKHQPFRARGNLSTNAEFEVRQKIGDTASYYLRIISNTQLLIPIKVNSQSAVRSADTDENILNGLYFGIMLVMFFYNLFVYLSVRDKSYLYYIVYITCVTLVQLNVTGLGFKYLWPNAPGFERLSVILFPSLTAFSSIAFMKEFLQTKQFTPRANKLFWVFIIAYLFTIINWLVGNKYLSYNLINANALPLALFMIGLAAFIRAKYKYRPATFFLISWTIFLVSIMLFVLKDFGVFPYNLLTVSFIQIGSAIEVVLLSIALADRINVLKKEKEASQEETIRIAQENARIISEQNVVLETKVKERTIELQSSNQELARTLQELKETESQLVESEKMASLGQLTAGIAHEINNPINFVTSNVNPLKRDVELLIDIVTKIEEVGLSEKTVTEKQQEIEELKTDLDFDYLKTEIDYLLKGIHEGASRTAEIVKGLRVFSRLDEDDLKKADINEGLNSTIVIVNHLLGSHIQVEKNYSGIPMVECYPGKLNQVFLNMMSNAIHAIHSRWGEADGGKLTISTKSDETNVYISIKDNGTGMDENTKRKLFEPFFTTKDVGEGTGLGLSIAYNTIKKHNGSVEVNSAKGEGTEFIIAIPINFV